MRLALPTTTLGFLLFSHCVCTCAAGQTVHASSAPLVNKDILEMQAAGLSSEIIIEKIKTSQCDFDSTAGALAELKRATVPEPVILLMMRCQSAPQAGRSFQSPNASRGPAYRGFALVPVESYQVLSFGYRNKPYGDILRLIENKLVDAVRARGVQRAAVQDGECCRVRMELLQATYDSDARRGATSRLVVNISVAGTAYSRRFQGDALRRRQGNRLDTRLDEAAAKVVQAVVGDDTLMTLVAGSKR